MVMIGISKVPGTDEYRVYWKENGRDSESKAYYTDDSLDAVGTLLNISTRNEVKGIPTKVSGDRTTSSLIRHWNASFGGMV